jgi:hypothetical protein
MMFYVNINLRAPKISKNRRFQRQLWVLLGLNETDV